MITWQNIINGNFRERGEFQLTSCLDKLRQSEGIAGYVVKGRCFDTGLPEVYRQTLIDFPFYSRSQESGVRSQESGVGCLTINGFSNCPIPDAQFPMPNSRYLISYIPIFSVVDRPEITSIVTKYYKMTLKQHRGLTAKN